MSESSKDFASALRDLAETARQQAGEPLSPAELLAYLDGDLPRDEMERLGDRLALDSHGSQTVLELLELSRMESGGEKAPEPLPGHVPEWASMKARLADDEATQPPGRQSVAVSRKRRQPRPAVRLAATVVAVLALGFLARSLLIAPSAPQKNVHWTHLQPQDADLSRDAGGWRTVRLPAGAASLVLILNLGDPGTFQDYRVEISTPEPDSEVLWSDMGFRPGPLGTFDLLLPREFLPEGRYRIRLDGLVSDEAPEALAVYRVELLHD